MWVVALFMVVVRPSHSFTGQLAGLLHPSGDLRLVELVVLVDVEVAHFLVLGLAGGHRAQRRAAEESHLDVLREAMVAEEPALALDAIEGRVPLHGLARVGDGAQDEGVERSEEHTSELQSLMRISYAVFCLKNTTNTTHKS